MNLKNISPVDGRYHNTTKKIQDYFSEYALIKQRVNVEVNWLLYLINNEITKIDISENTRREIENLVKKFNVNEARKVKKIEEETKHDVKAIEYYLRDKLKEIGAKKLIPFIHFAITSEDTNNISYSLMISSSLEKVYYKELIKLVDNIESLSKKYKEVSMLGHTHGQPATPTTVGKEFKVYSYRLSSIIKLLKKLKLRCKFSGAVGNYNCHIVAYPEIDWIKTSKDFVEKMGFEYNPLTTQIESHDILCVLLSYIKIINNIIKDLDSDMWLYISNGYFKEKTNSNEIGSSVMPHKVNPINYENSIANTEISNSLIDALVNNLSISRMQRDLSDSSKLRNLGVIFAHSLISINETLKGLKKIEIEKEYLKEELNNHYEVLSEAIQTVLRKNGYQDAYEQLKKLSRGKKVDKEAIEKFIKKLEIPNEEKRILLNLTPEKYTGLAQIIVDNN